MVELTGVAVAVAVAVAGSLMGAWVGGQSRLWMVGMEVRQEGVGVVS